MKTNNAKIIILSILKNKGPSSWYRLELLAPLHSNYTDDVLIRSAIKEMINNNLIELVNDYYQITKDGINLLSEMEK